MGGCGGDDASAPGTYLLRAGALPPLETALTQLDECKEALAQPGPVRSRSCKEVIVKMPVPLDAEGLRLDIKQVIDKLRALAARADAAAAELIAEEESSAARGKPKSGKTSSKGKGGKAAKAARAAKKQQPPAAAAINASAAALDAAPPPPAAAAAPEATPPTPPALPPLLLDAMQRLPPPSAASQPPSAPPPVNAVPRHLDTSDGSCAICLDAPAVLRTRCCAKQGPVFCESCAALLAGVTRCALCGVDAAELSGAGTAER
jgi:hypothetical protein